MSKKGENQIRIVCIKYADDVNISVAYTILYGSEIEPTFENLKRNGHCPVILCERYV